MRYWIAVLVLAPNLLLAQPLEIDLTYDDLTGDMSIFTNLTEGAANVRIVSESGIFTRELGQGIWDQHAHKIEMNLIDFLGSDLHLGLVADEGFTHEFLNSDLCIDASREISSATLMGQPFDVDNERCFVHPNPNLPIGVPVQRAIVHYDPNDGNVFVDVGVNARITAFELRSAARIFTGDPAQGLGNHFDVDRDGKIFKLLPAGFSDIDFGNVAERGLSNNEFLSSICSNGAWFGGGVLDAEYLFPGAGTVPIPNITGNRFCDIGAPTSDIEINYNTTSGALTITADGFGQVGEDVAFTVLQVRSEQGNFIGDPDGLLGQNDQFSNKGLLKVDLEGFSSLRLGNVLPPGMTADEILSDLSFDAVFSNNSLIRNIKVVPEPTSYISILLMMVVVGRLSRRGRR